MARFHFLTENAPCKPLLTEMVSCATSLSKGKLGTDRFERFSSLTHLFNAITRLLHIAKSFKGVAERTCHGWYKCNKHITQDQHQQDKASIIHVVHPQTKPT